MQSNKESELFVSQRHHRIDAHGASRRNVAGSDRYQCKQDRHARKGRWVVGAHAEEQVRDESGESERSDDSDCDSRERHQNPVTFETL